MIFSRRYETSRHAVQMEDTGDWVAGNIYTLPPLKGSQVPPHLAAFLICEMKGTQLAVTYHFSLKMRKFLVFKENCSSDLSPSVVKRACLPVGRVRGDFLNNFYHKIPLGPPLPKGEDS